MIQEKIKEIKNLGWEVANQSFTHPHDNKYVELYSFKSPRMHTYQIFHQNTNVFEVEAKTVANQFFTSKQSSIKESMFSDIVNYFMSNLNERESTEKIKLKLLIDEN